MAPDALDPAARRALTSLLAFWAEAGVDCAYADAAVDRLAPPSVAIPRPATPPVAATPPRRPPAGAPSRQAEAAAAEALRLAKAAPDLPALLEAARALGTATDLLVAPVASPQVAWVIAAPDADDLAAGRLLAGPRGRLFERMMRAAGLEGRAMVVAATPPPGAPGAGPNVAAAAAQAVLAERALQLAAPRAVVAAGAEALRALTGADEPILKAHGRLRDWRGAHLGLALPLMPTFALETLLAQPSAKARAWRDILTLRACVDSATQAP